MSLSKNERALGWRLVARPNEQQVAVLRRVAKGFLLVTQGIKGKQYSYEDGSPITSLNKKGDNSRAIARMIAEGWLIPVEKEVLPFAGEPMPPQRYRARTVADGPLPRFIQDA